MMTPNRAKHYQVTKWSRGYSEEVKLPSAEKKTKPAQPKAAVQGIRPSQPAPIREEKLRESSFIDKFFGWFKPASHEEIKETPKQTETKVGREKSQRPERGKRVRRDRRRNPQNKETLAKESRKQNDLIENNEDAGGRLLHEQPAAENVSNQKHKEGQPQRNTEVLTEEKPKKMDTIASTADESGRSRRRRSSRKRDRPDSDKVSQKNNVTNTRDTLHEPITVQTEDVNFTVNSIFDEKNDVPEIIDTSAQQQATIIAAGTIGEAVKSDQRENTAPTKKEKPSTVKTETEPDQSPFELTTTSTTKPATDPINLKESGLVMIETTADKIEETTGKLLCQNVEEKELRLRQLQKLKH